MAGYEIARTPDQVDEVLNLADDAEENGKTAYRGMTFEQGVSQGIRWLTGLGDAEPPLP